MYSKPDAPINYNSASTAGGQTTYSTTYQGGIYQIIVRNSDGQILSATDPRLAQQNLSRFKVRLSYARRDGSSSAGNAADKVLYVYQTADQYGRQWLPTSHLYDRVGGSPIPWMGETIPTLPRPMREYKSQNGFIWFEYEVSDSTWRLLPTVFDVPTALESLMDPLFRLFQGCDINNLPGGCSGPGIDPKVDIEVDPFAGWLVYHPPALDFPDVYAEIFATTYEDLFTETMDPNYGIVTNDLAGSFRINYEGLVLESLAGRLPIDAYVWFANHTLAPNAYTSNDTLINDISYLFSNFQRDVRVCSEGGCGTGSVRTVTIGAPHFDAFGEGLQDDKWVSTVLASQDPRFSPGVLVDFGQYWGFPYGRLTMLDLVLSGVTVDRNKFYFTPSL